MAKDNNVSNPTPGDPGYYDFITGTGKYAPKAKLPVAAPKKVKKVVKQSGLGLNQGNMTASEKMLAGYENDAKKKKIFSGSAKDTVKKAFKSL